eukprot:5950151-Alexandrium_andersonii.AAC.1
MNEHNPRPAHVAHRGSKADVARGEVDVAALRGLKPRQASFPAGTRLTAPRTQCFRQRAAD